MNQLPIIIHLLSTATTALEAKAHQVRPHLQKATVRKVNQQQADATEKDLKRVLVPLFEQQIKRMASQLKEMTDKEESGLQTKSTSSALSLIDHAFDQKQATNEIIDTVFPILAVRMAEAARNQLLLAGVDVRKKGESAGHPFRGNQWSGRGRGGVDPVIGGGAVAGDSTQPPQPSPKPLTRQERKEAHHKYAVEEAKNRIAALPSTSDVDGCKTVAELKEVASKAGIADLSFKGFDSWQLTEMMHEGRVVVNTAIDCMRKCPKYMEAVVKTDTADQMMPDARRWVEHKGRLGVSFEIHNTSNLLLPNTVSRCGGYFNNNDYSLSNRVAGIGIPKIHLPSGRYNKNPSKLQANDFLVDSSFQGAVRHEMGHLVDHALGVVYETNTHTLIGKLESKMKSDPGSIIKSVSSYSTTTRGELFAEMFCAATHKDFDQFEKSSKPSPLLKRLYQEITKS
jgi:hypothetical protein